ncbi:timeless protein-domain-containing protein [Absidia repens]|uniref:Timeless protein-domain-containing protein n=1 Tax=Absidia repens TaxID=90262 RepID=A0A1X2IVA8_9FUNG|nr:timeless protein-domain-containing protein [Absidia repens]
MEEAIYPEDIQKTRRLILSTCTALGGFDNLITEEGDFKRVYSVGDEALACLKDLKRIIRADELLTRDVLIELNVLETDLIPIMLINSKMATATAERFILACVEIIVPLTWPIPQKPEEMDVYQDPNLLHSYRKLKLKLLEKGVFEAVLRLCVKSLRIPYRDRSTRDQSIIRLTLYFWRNLTAIVDPKATVIASSEQYQLSKLQERLLIRFHESNVLELLLTMASTAGTTDSNEWHIILLEIVYNLLKFSDAKETAFTKEEKDKSATKPATSNKLSALLESENNNKRRKLQSAPSRHNRFGGAYTLEGWDGSKLVTHKQSGGYAPLDQLISLQKKNRAGLKRKQIDEIGTYSSYEDPTALLYLKRFGLSFWNHALIVTFYLSILKDMQREDKSIVEQDYARFYYTQGWFLELFMYEYSTVKAKQREQEKQNQEAAKDQLILPNRSQQQSLDSTNNARTASSDESPPLGKARDDITTTTTTNQKESTMQDENVSTLDYDLIANAMDLGMFWACMRRIRICIDGKLWFDVQVTADCLRRLLAILGIMGRSPESEYRDVAEYIQSNIYHEQSTLDIFPDLIRTYSNQSFGYIATTMKLIHTMLKMLEQYCKKQQVTFVRKKKPQRKLKAKSSDTSGPADKEMDADDSDGSQTEEDRDREIAYREHVFSFESFEKRFATYDFVRVSCILLEEYQYLQPEVLHAITNVFHRIMVKTKVEHLFWKLPTLELFNRILQDRAYIPKSVAFDELVRFIRYVVRQFFKKAETYPLLFIEILFKIEPCRIVQNKNPSITE